MENCNSFLTEYLKKKSVNVNKVFKYLNFTQYDIISIGLIFNAWAIYSLLNGDFYFFLFLLILSYCCNFLNILYVKQYNSPTKYGDRYDKSANWFKLILLTLIFTEYYENKIDNIIIGCVLLVFILCNIHYSLKTCIKKKKNFKLDNFHEWWITPICNIKIDNLNNYCKYTKYFDENLVFVYIFIIMIYINHK